MAKDEKNKKIKEPKNSFLKESKTELKTLSWDKSAKALYAIYKEVIEKENGDKVEGF